MPMCIVHLPSPALSKDNLLLCMTFLIKDWAVTEQASQITQTTHFLYILVSTPARMLSIPPL